MEICYKCKKESDELKKCELIDFQGFRVVDQFCPSCIAEFKENRFVTIIDLDEKSGKGDDLAYKNSGELRFANRANKCENCNNEAELKAYVIKDANGTKYRNLCKNCADEISKKPDVMLELQNEERSCRKTTFHISNAERSASKMVMLYETFSIILAVCGFIAGPLLGKLCPLITIEYIYTNETFNVPLMFYIWIGTAILFFAFWGIRCILKNQEMLLKTHSTNK